MSSKTGTLSLRARTTRSPWRPGFKNVPLLATMLSVAAVGVTSVVVGASEPADGSRESGGAATEAVVTPAALIGPATVEDANFPDPRIARDPTCEELWEMYWIAKALGEPVDPPNCIPNGG